MAAEPSRLTSRSVLLWSCGGLAFLLLVALVCWLVLGPYFEVRAALDAYSQMRYQDLELNEKTLARLGGPKQAFRKLSLYLRVPERWAGEKPLAAALLGKLGPQAAGATATLVDLLATPDTPGQPSGEDNRGTAMRRSAAGALGGIGPAAARAAPMLEAALRDRDTDVRVEAARALTRIRPQDGLEPWAGLLADPDNHCRDRAAYELGKTGSTAKSFLPALEQRLAIENQAPDRLNKHSNSWYSIRCLRSAIWKIGSEPDPGPEANREVRTKLEKRWTFEFVGVPFEEALQRAADAGGFKVVIAPSLIGPDESGNAHTITLKMTPAPYDLILEWICKLRDCDWTVKDGAVYVFDDKELK